MMERESIAGSKKARGSRRAHKGLAIERYFTTAGVDPTEEMAWETRTAGITGEGGNWWAV